VASFHGGNRSFIWTSPPGNPIFLDIGLSVVNLFYLEEGWFTRRMWANMSHVFLPNNLQLKQWLFRPQFVFSLKYVLKGRNNFVLIEFRRFRRRMWEVARSTTCGRLVFVLYFWGVNSTLPLCSNYFIQHHLCSAVLTPGIRNFEGNWTYVFCIPIYWKLGSWYYLVFWFLVKLYWR